MDSVEIQTPPTLRACLKCGWIHFPRTPDQVKREVDSFNAYYAKLSPEKQQDYYGGKPSKVEDYQRCFRCGGSHLDFRNARDDEVRQGSTIQPIMSE